jgi:hypothetical protein
MVALARATGNCKLETRHRVREGVPHVQTRSCLDSNENVVFDLKWDLVAKTEWPTDRSSNLTLTLQRGERESASSLVESRERPPLGAATKQRCEDRG